MNEESKKGNWDGMADLITDEMLEVYTVMGSSDDIADKVVERYQGILDRAMYYYPFMAGTQDDKWRKYLEVLHAAGNGA